MGAGVKVGGWVGGKGGEWVGVSEGESVGVDVNGVGDRPGAGEVSVNAIVGD